MRSDEVGNRQPQGCAPRMSLPSKLLGSNMLIRFTPYEDRPFLLVLRGQDRHSFLAFSRKFVRTFEMSPCNKHGARTLHCCFVVNWFEHYHDSCTFFTSALFVGHFSLLLSPPMQCDSHSATPNIFLQHIFSLNLSQETFDEISRFLRTFVD